MSAAAPYAVHAALVARAEALGALGIIADAWLTSTGFFYRMGYRMPGVVFMLRRTRALA